MYPGTRLRYLYTHTRFRYFYPGTRFRYLYLHISLYFCIQVLGLDTCLLISHSLRNTLFQGRKVVTLSCPAENGSGYGDLVNHLSITKTSLDVLRVISLSVECSGIVLTQSSTFFYSMMRVNLGFKSRNLVLCILYKVE